MDEALRRRCLKTGLIIVCLLWPAVSVPLLPAEEPASTPKPATDAERVAEAFRGESLRMVAELVWEMEKQPSVLTDWKKQLNAKDDADLRDKMAAIVLKMFAKSFGVTGGDAARLAAGRFDDTANRAVVKASIEEFEKTHATLPKPVEYWVSKSLAGKIRDGIELEFAARIVWGNVVWIRNPALRDRTLKTLREPAPPATPSDADRSRLRDQIKALGSASHAERETAMNTLEEAGDAAEPFLVDALRADEPEVRTRAKDILRRSGWYFPGSE